jgi:DNA replication protein DnaC
MKGTGQWIKDADQYREWRESDKHGCLWINGMPGSGKSVVAARTASDLAKDKDALVVFFFFRYIILTNRTPHDLIRDWMAQMLDRSIPLQAKLKSLMKK